MECLSLSHRTSAVASEGGQSGIFFFLYLAKKKKGHSQIITNQISSSAHPVANCFLFLKKTQQLHFGFFNPGVASSEDAAGQDTVDTLLFHPRRAPTRPRSSVRARVKSCGLKTVTGRKGLGEKGGGSLLTCDPERTDKTVQADSKCRSPGDARVNAGAMSRRKQVNPQHLSLTHRETIQGELNFTCYCF